MAKDPAFLFYPNDYIGGTMGMTFEQKGAYMELLMLQFNRGHMTKHMIGQTVGQLWGQIQDKFTEDANGLWFNERLEAEQIKRVEYSKSRRNNILGKNQYSNKDDLSGGHMTSHMENENENEIINTNKGKGIVKGKGFKKPKLSEVEDYLFSKFPDEEHEALKSQADRFINHFDANGWVVTRQKIPMKSWRGALGNWMHGYFDKIPKKQTLKERANF